LAKHGPEVRGHLKGAKTLVRLDSRFVVQSWQDGMMVVSFAYLAFVWLLKLLIRSGRHVDVKDVELLVLRQSARGPASAGRASEAATA
jgi:hypothetical protein